MTTFIGIDWSRDSHQVNVYNQSKELVVSFKINHDYTGFQRLSAKLAIAVPDRSACKVGIETHHNLLVDFLYSLGYKLYVVAPVRVAANRGRQSAAGAKSDDKDAALLADILRTEPANLLLWQPDGPLVRRLRVELRIIDQLTQEIVRKSNRLSEHLLRYYPQALDAFSSVRSKTLLHWLKKHPSPRQLPPVEFADFEKFCRAHRYRNRLGIAKSWQNLSQPTPHDDPDTDAVFSPMTPILADRLLTDIELKEQRVGKLVPMMKTHRSYPIFASVPGAGTLLTAQLVGIYGDHLDRYPTPDIVRALAGTCPVTRQSGKRRVVRFRRSCNRQWRQTFQQLARSATTQSDWAATFFADRKMRGNSTEHAYRCLGNRLVNITWTIWQRGTLYDEQVHLRNLHQFKR